MDFKKQNRYNEGRSKLAIPQRGDTVHDTPHDKQSDQKPTVDTTTAIASKTPHKKNTRSSKQAAYTRVRRILLTKKAIVASIAVVVVAGSLAANALIQQQSANNGQNGNSRSLIENIEYQTVIPEGKSISDLGGWKRVSPSKSDPVYAYIDAIDGIPVSVSQQPLPKPLKGEVSEQIAELAEKFNATSKIDSNDMVVYVGTSAKGPQSAIFTKNGLLILIKSQSKIDDDSWTYYAKSLN